MRQKRHNEFSDDELIDLYLNTQSNLYFSLLYDRYITKVYSKCISLLKDEELAQDATQEIFLKIFTNLPKFGKRSKFSTWVYSITYNYCIDFLRKKNKDKKIFANDENEGADAIEETDDKLLLEMEFDRLKIVLELLPIDDKAVLLMKYKDDLSIRDISEIFDKTESAIKMKIKRAKHRCQKLYQDTFKDDE